MSTLLVIAYLAVAACCFPVALREIVRNLSNGTESIGWSPVETLGALWIALMAAALWPLSLTLVTLLRVVHPALEAMVERANVEEWERQ